MVESTALEMRRTGNRTVGSNPTLSAKAPFAIILMPGYRAALTNVCFRPIADISSPSGHPVRDWDWRGRSAGHREKSDVVLSGLEACEQCIGIIHHPDRIVGESGRPHEGRCLLYCPAIDLELHSITIRVRVIE